MTDKNKSMTYHVAKSDVKKRRSRKHDRLDTKIVNPNKLRLETCWLTKTPVLVEHINKKRKVLVESLKSKDPFLLPKAECINHSIQEPIANENEYKLSSEAPVSLPSPGLVTNNVTTDSFISTNTTIQDCQGDVIHSSEDQSQHSEPANVKTFLDVLCSPVLKTKKVIKKLRHGKRGKNEVIYVERDLISQGHPNKKTTKEFFKSSKLSCKRKLELSVESDISQSLKHSKQNLSQIIDTTQCRSVDGGLVSNTTLDAVFNTTDLFEISQAPTLMKADLNVGKDNSETEEVRKLEASQTVTQPPFIKMQNAVTCQPHKSFARLSLNTGSENTALIPGEGKEIIIRPPSNEDVGVMKSKDFKVKSNSVNLYSCYDKSPIPHKNTADSGPVSIYHILETAEMIVDADFNSELSHRKIMEKGHVFPVSKKSNNRLNKILSFNDVKQSYSSELEPTKSQQSKTNSDIFLKPNVPTLNSKNLSNRLDSTCCFNRNEHNSPCTYINHKHNSAIELLNNKTLGSTEDKYLSPNSYQSNKVSYEDSSKVPQFLNPEFLDNCLAKKFKLNGTTTKNDDLEMDSGITDTQLFCVGDFADIILDSQWTTETQNCNKSFNWGSSFNAGDKSNCLEFTDNTLHKLDSLPFEEKVSLKITPLEKTHVAKEKGKVLDKKSAEEIQSTKMDKNMEHLYVKKVSALIQSTTNTETLDGSIQVGLISSPRRITNNYHDTISKTTDFVSQVITSLDCSVPIQCSSQTQEGIATFTCPTSPVLGKYKTRSIENKFGNVKNSDTAMPTIKSVNMNNERKVNECYNGKLLKSKTTINVPKIKNDHKVIVGQVDELSSETHFNARLKYDTDNTVAVDPAINSLNLDRIKTTVEIVRPVLKTKPLFEKENNWNETPYINGIKPAVKEEVEMTRESILKGGKVFEDEIVSSVSSFMKGVNIAGIKMLYDSFESLLKSKVYPEDANGNVTPVEKGFKIACRKELAETRAALLNARQMREEDFETMNSLIDIEARLEASETKGNVSREVLLQTKHMLENENSGNWTPLVKGFVTASGKRVEVSKESLLKARQAFSEEGFKNEKPPMESFETGSGRNADVSKDSCFVTVPVFAEEVVQNILPIINKFETTREKNLEMCNEYKLKRRQLYDEENVGNVTTLVKGFITASGKRVEVTKESLFKARQAFSEEDVENLKPVMKSFLTCNGEKVDMAKALCLKTEPVLAEEVVQKIAAVTNQLETARDKKLKTSSVYKLKARQLFEEGSLAPIRNGFVTANGNRVEVSKKSLLKARQVLSAEDFGKVTLAMKKVETFDGEKGDLSKNVCSRPDFAEQVVGKVISIIDGSETIDGNELKVCRNELENNGQVFKEEDNGYFNPSKINGTYNGDVDLCLQEKHDLAQEHVGSVTPIMKGIETASGNELKVSSGSLLRAQQLLFEEKNVGNFTPAIGFETANGKSIELSRQSLLKARVVFEEEKIVNLTPGLTSLKDNVRGVIDASDSCLKIRHEFSDKNVINTNLKIKGFETASGKKIELSRNLLARQVFKDEGNLTQGIDSLKLDSEEKADVSNNICLNERLKFAEDFSNTTPLTKCFETASGKKVEVSRRSLLKARELFEGENIGNVTPTRGLKGFETANGENVTVSREALLKANKVFGGSGNLTPVRNSSIADGGDKVVDTSRDCCLVERKKNCENLRFMIPFFNGFETASGKKVEIKRESLLKARYVLGEDEIVTASPIMNDSEIDSGKKMEVSMESYLKRKEIIGEDIGNFNPNINCYSNQSGDTVEMTRESLLKMSEGFGYNDFGNETPEMKEFETASRKMVEVSIRESLLKARQDSAEDVGNVTLKSDKPVFVGFKTDSGNKEEVTRELFSKTRQVFGEDGMIDLTKDRKFSCKQKLEEPILETKEVFRKEGIVNSASKFKNTSGKSCMLSKCPVSNCKENGNFAYYNNPVQNLPDIINQSVENEQSLQLKRPLSPVISGVKNKRTIRRMMSTTENYLHCKQNLSNLSVVDLSDAESKANYFFSRNLLAINKNSLGQENSLEGIIELPEANLSQLSPIINEVGCSNKKIEGACSDLVDKDLWFEKEVQNISLSTVHEVSESTAAFLADEVESFEVPDWVVAYHSSPSFLTDRPRAHSSHFFSDEWEKIEKRKPPSPILGSNDRFKKKLNVKCSLNKYGAITRSPKHCAEQIKMSAASSTPVSTFKAPFKTSTPSQTPTDHRNRTKKRISSQLDFSAPFKQKHMLSSEIQASKISTSPQFSKEVVIEGRRKASEAQEIAIKNSNSEQKHFCVGSHLFHRLTDKTISLREAVKDQCPSLLSCKQLMALGVKKSIICITSRTAVDFRFQAKDYYSTKICEQNMDGICVGDGARLVLDSAGTAGVEEVTRCFLSSPSVDPALVSAAWVCNHYKWIVWKMASTERAFPVLFANRYLTPNNMLLQLRYRYDREVDQCQRPALRKVLETDESAGRRMVLVVAAISIVMYLLVYS